jgi:TonB family protein
LDSQCFEGALSINISLPVWIRRAATVGVMSCAFFALGIPARSQFKEIGPAPFSATTAHQEMRTLLDKVDAGNRQATVQRLSYLTAWFRDILDEELIAAWRRDGRANLQGVIEQLADPAVAAGIIQVSWHELRQATFTAVYAPMLGDLMSRYGDSAKPFLDDLLNSSTSDEHALDLSASETETVCRILVDLPDLRDWRKNALQILPHYRAAAESLLEGDLHGDNREKSYAAQRWLTDLGAPKSTIDTQRSSTAVPTPKPSSTKRGVILAPLDAVKVDDTFKSIDSNTPTILDLVNRSSGPVDIYWIDFNGDRVLYKARVAVGATVTEPTFLTHPWLVVASGTGGTTAQDTGIRIAGFQAATSNINRDPAIRDTAVITGAYSSNAPQAAAVRPAVPQVSTMVHPKDGLTYVWIAPGSFATGCSEGDTECDSGEAPQHEERISEGFWLGQTEVTQSAYRRMTNSDPSDHKGDQLPVENVAWKQALDYCSAIGGHLPTEVEWEYAARAGTKWARYGDLDAVAWYSGNSGGVPHSVGLKQPNAFGLFDMLGNVWEWMEDSQPLPDNRVLRGGSAFVDARNSRVSQRAVVDSSLSSPFKGFRCGGDWPPPKASPVVSRPVNTCTQSSAGVYRGQCPGLSRPALVRKTEPEYSEEARKAKFQGVVVLQVEIDPTGRVVNPRVMKSLGLGLDEQAIKAVRKWKFDPARLNGKPVTVVSTIEVNFRLL